MQIKSYLSNPRLKREGQQVSLTQEQLESYIKCANDPIYFLENYMKVVTIDRGLVQISLYPYQKDIVESCHNERKVAMKMTRQSGKTTTTVGYILWYILFNEMKTCALLANKERTAREILSRVKLAYENLPIWMQQGVVEWNKGSIDLENGSKVVAASTSSSAIRGTTINLLYLDEFAFVPNNIADEFFSAVYPTISSGSTSKIIISSTPNGMNHFYKICTEAKQGRNGFKLIEVDWRKVPGRDERWAQDQRATLGEDKFLQEMEGEFLGSAGTLISTSALKSLSFVDCLKNILGGLQIYTEVQSKKNYVLVADTARGTGLDYSAFVVVDIDEVPYRIVAKYRNNVISPMLFPNIIVQAAKYYNDAFLLIENNDAGGQVADTILNDLDYDNMFYTEEVRGTTLLNQRMGAITGVRTTKKVKRLGCNALKSLVESHKLIIEDYDIINELATFILKRDTYQADDGCNDDLAMCLVLFSWMTTQPFFRDLTNTDIRQKLFDEKIKQMEEDMLPFPSNNEEAEKAEKYSVEDGIVWETGPERSRYERIF
jgi:hypothetical protein